MFEPNITCTRLWLCSDQKIVIDSDTDFAKRVLNDKPPKDRRVPLNASKPLRILVFSDPHIDFDYMEVSLLIFLRTKAVNVTIDYAAEKIHLTPTIKG